MHGFSTTIRRARKSRGWTLDHVARRLGTNKGYVSGIEMGRVNPPSAELVLKLASVYHLDPTELLLLALAEKAPKQVRAELRRRLFGVGRSAARKEGSMAERKRLTRIAKKIARLRMAFDDLLADIGYTHPVEA